MVARDNAITREYTRALTPRLRCSSRRPPRRRPPSVGRLPLGAAPPASPNPPGSIRPPASRLRALFIPPAVAAPLA
ncbi:hypothetical protein GUJ93_ZPchr0005g15031 [Zizania palustris]|uniref:Uncharacterized protein n=1 Tax=Zizania palustris TaxID=103762 RepID=A0A8J5SWV3_ZIZPA|nr:hypothetical protein GUJ93_ZPchr0005g15031 [Zizania palustris]